MFLCQITSTAAETPQIVSPGDIDRILWDVVCWLTLAGTWMIACLWIRDDSLATFGRPTRWPLALVVTGAMLLVATFIYGLGVYRGFTAVLLVEAVAYVRCRDRRLPATRRLLSPGTAARAAMAVAYHAPIGNALAGRLSRWLERRHREIDTHHTGTLGTGTLGIDGISSHLHDKWGEDGTEQHTRLVRRVRRLIAAAIELKASKITFSTRSLGAVVVRFRIEGSERRMAVFSAESGGLVIDALKKMARIRKRNPNSNHATNGWFSMPWHARTVSIRATSESSNRGDTLSLALRHAEESIVAERMEGIGMDACVATSLRKILSHPNGVLLVSGPSASGKTVTAYTAIKELVAMQRTVVTVESPIELRMPYIQQFETNPTTGLTFPGVIASALRFAPDAIFVGDCGDPQTAKIALETTWNGQLVIAAYEAQDSAAALAHMLTQGLDVRLMQTTLSAVLAQRLIRTLCSSCKEPYEPPREFYARARIPPHQSIIIYRKKGCASCFGTGYKGQKILAELLIIDNKIRTMLMLRRSRAHIRSTARQSGMKTLREYALDNVLRGSTSIEEIAQANL